MVSKEGNALGIKAIQERLQTDEALIKKAFSLYGIPKIILCNSIPVGQAPELVDDCEITPEYVYYWNPKTKKVETKERPWVIKDDDDVPCYSLLPPPVVVTLIKQIVDLM